MFTSVLVLGVLGGAIFFGIPAALLILYGMRHDVMVRALWLVTSIKTTTVETTAQLRAFICEFSISRMVVSRLKSLVAFSNAGSWFGNAPLPPPQPGPGYFATLRNMSEFVYAFFFGIPSGKK